MTRDEAKKIVMITKEYYPTWKSDNWTFTVDAWMAILKDYDYADVERRLRAFIITDDKGFPPSIGQIISKIHTATDRPMLSESEAWAMVSKALRNGIYGYQEEYDKLPSEVQSAVGSPMNLCEWAQMDMETVQSVIQSNFMRNYRTRAKQQQEFARMPKDIQQMIAATKTVLPAKGA